MKPQSFGPYTLAPGDSVRIVLAESYCGISREKNIEVAKNWWTWYNNNKSGGGPFILPNGSTTTDGNIYKNSWVFTGKDSFSKLLEEREQITIAGINSAAATAPDKFCRYIWRKQDIADVV